MSTTNTDGAKIYRTEGDLDLSTDTYQDVTLEGNLRLEVMYAFYNHKKVYTDHIQPEWHAVKNTAKRFAEEFAEFARYHLGGKKFYRGSLVGLQDKKKGPLIICGSGPSLDTHIERFVEWPHAIMCSNSQASTLKFYNVDPTHIVIYDSKCVPEHSIWCIPKNKWDYQKTDLITNISSHPSFTTWPGNIYYYAVWDPHIDLYDKVIITGYHFLKTLHLPFACSLTAQISFAKYMGYGPIYLFGADFGYRSAGEKSRFTSVRYETPEGMKHPRWVRRQYGESASNHWNVKFGPYVTEPLTAFYRRTTMAIYWLEAPDLISCSDGLLEHDKLIPSMDGGVVIDAQGVAPPSKLFSSLERKRADIAPWLAANNQYWLELGEDPEGKPQYKLVEMNDPEHQLPIFLARFQDEGGGEVDMDVIVAKALDDLKEAKKRGYYIHCEPGPDGVYTEETKRDVFDRVKNDKALNS